MVNFKIVILKFHFEPWLEMKLSPWKKMERFEMGWILTKLFLL